ncbi:MAG TPA: HAD family phosphatase [Syntrophorhabdus sp.]|jgi:putative hydrolase of the HAD superfamily|nr:HAD family phosphatase [Syntrophorhabdus sp.]OPX96890.1 MAG: Alpha-D-glucose-1-phosphate phosphatase YihX [Syntrophorhabdus sp. PtaB.Bin027]HNY69935.1 HAD family phosphatase [Syntrophorhabdus sp.]HOD78462.1 HAD family phosphatase [Syntrophorhabdus sp.]HOH26513.1 HAD family phosphatase [Syntrophorhabdus sp.]
MIKLFVFDLGNVILPFEHRQIAVKLHEKSTEKEAFTPEQLFDVMFDLQNGLINPYEEGLMSSAEFLSNLKRQFRLDIDMNAFSNIWNPIFRDDPEVNKVIFYLKEKRYPLFLLSNTNELHFSYIMENYPIVHWFDEWLLSFEVGAKKPKQRIYDAIFEKMDVKPNEVFYVDDISKYVETAQQLGLHGVVFRSAAQLWDFIQKNGI